MSDLEIAAHCLGPILRQTQILIRVAAQAGVAFDDNAEVRIMTEPLHSRINGLLAKNVQGRSALLEDDRIKLQGAHFLERSPARAVQGSKGGCRRIAALGEAGAALKQLLQKAPVGEPVGIAVRNRAGGKVARIDENVSRGFNRGNDALLAHAACGSQAEPLLAVVHEREPVHALEHDAGLLLIQAGFLGKMTDQQALVLTVFLQHLEVSVEEELD